MTERQLKMVHLQLTRSCNLRCWFCGQWGRKGFFSNACGTELALSEWERVIASLVRHREQTGETPNIMLWGGEPLVSPLFDEVATTLLEEGFRLGLVTNGTLLDRHPVVSEFDRIYVSIDGPREVHDSIRGDGVFDRVMDNLERLAHPRLTIMTVLTEQLLGVLDELPQVYRRAGAQEVLLQQMIALDDGEIAHYKRWMESAFGIEARFIDSWKSDALIVEANCCPPGFTYLPHTTEGCCRSPFSHIHVAWNGDVMYCTDFYDFSAGNVREQDVMDIFRNDRSDLFRAQIQKGNCVTCDHCSWRQNTQFDF